MVKKILCIGRRTGEYTRAAKWVMLLVDPDSKELRVESILQRLSRGHEARKTQGNTKLCIKSQWVVGTRAGGTSLAHIQVAADEGQIRPGNGALCKAHVLRQLNPQINRSKCACLRKTVKQVKPPACALKRSFCACPECPDGATESWRASSERNHSVGRTCSNNHPHHKPPPLDPWPQQVSRWATQKTKG